MSACAFPDTHVLSTEVLCSYLVLLLTDRNADMLEESLFAFLLTVGNTKVSKYNILTI